MDIISGSSRYLSLQGRLGHYLGILGLGLLFIALHVYYGFETLNTPDPYDYLQLARNIARGTAFRTDIITPLSWSLVPDLTHHPDLWRAPLYPVLVASGFRLFGVKEIIPLVISAGMFLIGVLIVHRLTERLYDGISALASGLLIVSFAPLLQFGVSAYTEACYVSLTVVSVLIVFWEEDHPYLLGFVSALAYLTRFNHWFFLAGLLWVGMSRSNETNWRYALKVFAIFFLGISPWLIRNYLLVGGPFYNHNVYLISSQNPLIPGYSTFFQFSPPEPMYFVLENPLIVLTKWVNNLLEVYRWIPRYFTHAWVVAVLAVIEVTREREENCDEVHQLLRIYAVGFVLQGIVMSFVFFKPRHYAPYLVLVFVLAGGSLGYFRTRSRRIFAGCLVVLVVLNGFYVVQMNPWSPDLSASDYRAVAKFVPREEPVMTNVPELTAWYADRTSLWITDYSEAKVHYPSFRYVLLSPEVPRNPSRKTDIRKHFLQNRNFHEDFRLFKEFPESGSRFYIRRNAVSDPN